MKYLLKILGIVLLSIAFILGLAWLLRIELLPSLLYLFAERYTIERIRYQNAQWATLGEIEFYQMEIERNGWKLAADTLTIRFFPKLSIRSRRGRLHRLRASFPEETASSKFPLSAVLRAGQKVLHLLQSIDTLEWQQLSFPSGIELSLRKAGDSCAFTVSRGVYRFSAVAKLRQDTFHLLSKCGTIKTEKMNAAWDEVTAIISIRKERLSAEGEGQGLQFFHPRLASRTLWYDIAGVRLEGSVSEDSLRLHLTTQKLPLEAHLRISAQGSAQRFAAVLDIPRQSHIAFLKAFPEGFFTCLSRADIAGTSALRIELRYDPTLPDTLALSIDWRPEDFAIRHWTGNPNPLMLNGTFSYRPYRSNRILQLGSASPTYLTFHEITPYVLHAVLHSEDGLFFQHQGFQKEPFLRALLENWHCRCFRRGAGTITMQLVRNLLLTREKTLARKVEEILLTAIIERFRLLSKERIAELYLNMIEWGPEIYGLVEAARFYFGKEPHQLTIPEAIFLGMLLPNPKAYRYLIDPQTGCVASPYKYHFQKIAYFLVRQNYLHPDSLESILPERACLRPPAWSSPDSPQLR